MRQPDRRAARQHDIVSAAADLFADSGYPAVGMDQIGAAAGITGPAIYRHFGSKAAVLAAVFEGIVTAVAAEPAADSGDTPDPVADLLAQIDVYAHAVAERRKLMAVWVREVHHLPPEHRLGLEQRQRALVRRWRTRTAQIHPDWTVEQVRTAVHAAFGMLNSVGTFDSPLSDGDLAAELDLLVRRALELP
ncbi:TetR family transcriptional regulator [Nakamurella sp. YIM 132087]|uniref:TetR family transcriptional regulator n=1 Tax=Nakamurella alba TaxID=2665158 RepID=A0A7K1FTC0_9ACTN|nr:TetR/AcrR family transcriptional regulator [Nakamurella alba]MTD17340.1 TetR family transcriptional regulator [Nakamurella alba]